MLTRRLRNRWPPSGRAATPCSKTSARSISGWTRRPGGSEPSSSGRPRRTPSSSNPRGPSSQPWGSCGRNAPRFAWSWTVRRAVPYTGGPPPAGGGSGSPVGGSACPEPEEQPELAEERRHRGRGNGHRTTPERDVPGATRERAQRVGAHLGEDADALHPDPSRGPRAGRALAVRPDAGQDTRDLLEPAAQAGTGLGQGREKSTWLASQASTFHATSAWTSRSATSTGSARRGRTRSSTGPASTAARRFATWPRTR